MKNIVLLLLFGLILLVSQPIFAQNSESDQKQAARDAYLRGTVDEKIGQVDLPKNPDEQARYLQGMNDAQDAQKEQRRQKMLMMEQTLNNWEQEDKGK